MSIKPVIESSIQSVIRPAIGFPSAVDPILATDHPDLIAMYDMGDTVSGNTLVDLSPNGNDGTIVNAVAVAGKIGNALQFDGVGDYLSLPATMLDSALSGSICGWVMRDNAASWTTILMSTNQNNNYHALNIRGDNSRFRVRHNNNASPLSDLETTTTYGAGSWAFYVVQSDGSTTELWVDDVQQTFTSGTNTGLWFGDLTTTSTALHVARFDVFGSVADADSEMKSDQYRIFNRALTPTEITTLYKEGNP